MKQQLKFHGYTCYFEHISYSCPALKLFGYSSERALSNAILKAIREKLNNK